jgi:hypothetical protein
VTALLSVSPVQATREAIQRVREAGAAHTLAIAHEAALQREKPIRKHDAIGRLMQTTNDLTSKVHSCTSAEAVVELDAAYFAFCHELTKATCQREMARTEAIAARLEAQLALALVLADGEEEAE